MSEGRQRIHEWAARYGSASREAVVFVFPGFEPLDAMGPFDVLTRVPDMRTRFVATDAGVIPASTNELQLDVKTAIEDVDRCDVLVIPGGSGTAAQTKDARVLAWIRKVAPQAAFVTSVCTGAQILGAAGLLRGRKATSHWLEMGRLEAYGATPATDRVVRDGNIVTAAGVSAGIDMALYLASELTCPEFAEMMQLFIEYEPEPPFRGSPRTVSPEIVSACREICDAMYAAAGEPLPAGRNPWFDR